MDDELEELFRTNEASLRQVRADVKKMKRQYDRRDKAAAAADAAGGGAAAAAAAARAAPRARGARGAARAARGRGPGRGARLRLAPASRGGSRRYGRRLRGRSSLRIRGSTRGTGKGHR